MRREAEALVAVGQVLDASADLTETVRRIARETARSLAADTVGIYLAAADGAALRPVAGYHVPGRLLAAFREIPFPLKGHAAVEEARRTGQPVWTSDARTDPRVDHDTWRRFPHRSTLLVPMLRDGLLIGAIVAVWWRKRRVCSPAEMRLAAALGTHGGVVIERARLREQSEQRRQSAEALAEVARILSGSLDPQEVGARITDSLRRLLAVKAARLWQVVAGTEALRLVASTEGEAERGLEMSAGIGIAAASMRRRLVVVSPDILADARAAYTEEQRERIARLGHRSALVAPLLADDRILGVLTASDEAGRVFSQEEVSLVSAFAAQAALALDNARVHQALIAHAGRLKTLARLNGMVSSSLRPEEVLGAIAKAAAELTGADVATIWHASDGARRVELVAASDPVLGDFPRRAMSYGEGMVGWVAARRERLEVPDVLAHERSMEHDWWRSRGLRAFLGVPVVSEDALIAVLALGGRRPFQLDGEALALIEAFATQAAVAMENARLYREAMQSERLLARERHALELVAAGAALPRVLDTLCHAVEDLSEGALCSILLLDRDGARLGHGAAPSLSAAYCEAIDGLTIGPAAGSCGSAAFLKMPVVVADVSTDPRWSEFRDLARAHGLAACWSVPVLSSGGAVLGTFAVYHRTPGEPPLAERALVDRVASLASIAIERSHEAEARRRLLERIISAQEEERARVARELHDETAQSLAALALGLDGLRAATSVGTARERAAELHRVARLALVEVRQMAWGLRPTVLDDLGLVPGIERYASVIAASRGIAVEVSAEGMEGVRLPRHVETALYRIAQEALSNVARHAQARSARLVLARAGASASLSVEDDGRGFDVAAALAHSRAGDALGLQGMRERAGMLGGSLHIASAPERGTRVLVRIPIEEEEKVRGQDQDPAR